MRIVQVTAHYPPDVVSGGTLVPQRLAHRMRRLGHDVRVYAGNVRGGRAPLTSWDDVDEHGTPVRWVSTTPFTAWSDPKNSINPGVTEDFRAWLAAEPADVVHLHSLQTLGAELVTVAARSGARVVVTMHDFWWSCARQFLVAPDMRPCSLAVEAGGCPCAVDHGWLVERNRALGRHLADADLVLVPSASAARVMVANGVDETRVMVDENGLPALPEAAPREEAEGDVRLLFAGGADPMKGLGVLLPALRGLRGTPGWTADLYGVDPASLGDLRGDARVRARPGYRPAELATVLASHDVLVLASVMRESHSILTREALGAGLAVVCTDTLGPEEVVEDGRNGLVVPAADPEALGAALRRLVLDPALVRRMQAEAPAVRVRGLDDQVAGLVGTYERLVEGPTLPDRTVDAAQDTLLRRVLFVVGIQGAPLRYRVHLPAEGLRSAGVHTDVRHYRDPEVLELAQQADAVVVYRVPATVQVLQMIDAVHARDRVVPVLYDIDDLIVDPGLRGQVHGLDGMDDAEVDLWWRGVARYRTTLEACDGYVGSTAILCERVGALTGLPTFRFANGVGSALGALSERALALPRDPGPLRIGYFSGTTTHDADWAAVEPAVLEVMRDRPDVELWLGGHLGTGPALDEVADRVRRLPMLPWTELPARLRQVDVNLAPLVGDSVFNESKSAIKWLEAALVETPTVASPTEPFREAVEHGRTGRLAADHASWVEALAELLDDAEVRARTGRLARREALLRWSPARQGQEYRRLLLEAHAGLLLRDAPRTTTWQPVADDEPWSAADAWVESYPPDDGTRPAGPWRLRWEAARRVHEAEGVGGVARRVAGKVGRRVRG
ncbi:glycosyltransferase [Cellulomonas sp. SLBN-39]|uniref:glycosyltransferase n=1 Tax=Cellulomonas sp. SLBN-39 TaxID=2768446 RepID=UPI00114F3329|nr:glycosyltransferase [Cellulomonas sp. SLBN-39]TQL03675.1 glycosyltransferase involved in cell wall biosynthesis [Cellulomonas sp. SLBN-39]